MCGSRLPAGRCDHRHDADLGRLRQDWPSVDNGLQIGVGAQFFGRSAPGNAPMIGLVCGNPVFSMVCGPANLIYNQLLVRDPFSDSRDGSY